MASSRSPPLDTAVSMTIVIALPELVEHIGQFLPHSDLLSCLQVCRSWSEIFLPLLWHTVDTRLGCWKNIMNRVNADGSLTGETEEWVKAIFAKHGHRIRHLMAHWGIVLEAAALSGRCTLLSSLIVGNMEHHQSLAHTPTTATTTTGGTTATISLKTTAETTAETTAADQDLPWVSMSGMSQWYENLKHREIVKHFWKLIQANAGLVRITLPGMGAMNDLSPAFVFETFASLPRLQELDLMWAVFDIPTILNTVPQLRRLRANSPKGRYSMNETFVNLLSMDLQTNTRVSKLLRALAQFPGLEELKLKSVCPEPPIVAHNAVSLSPKFLSVKSLQIVNSSRTQDRYAALLVGQLPNLVVIRTPTLFADMQKALWKHCYNLDEIHSVNAWSVDAWRRRRVEDASRGQE
ncbi:MAG: hypothetical protein J3R72DRAFT_445080 [Linnemannia gamsii]|nr:MAG: hypothetical protein J3R72DRAFT_445080 [Linnemannia gamsii]